MELNETGKLLRDAVNKAQTENVTIHVDLIKNFGIGSDIVKSHAALIEAGKELHKMVNSEWLYENFASQ